MVQKDLKTADTKIGGGGLIFAVPSNPGALSSLTVKIPGGKEKGVLSSVEHFTQFADEFVQWMDTYTPPLNYAFFLHAGETPEKAENPKRKQIVLAVNFELFHRQQPMSSTILGVLFPAQWSAADVFARIVSNEKWSKKLSVQKSEFVIKDDAGGRSDSVPEHFVESRSPKRTMQDKRIIFHIYTFDDGASRKQWLPFFRALFSDPVLNSVLSGQGVPGVVHPAGLHLE